MRHRLANRVAPPLVAALVGACLWYAAANRSQPLEIATVANSPTPPPTGRAPTANADLLPAVSPVVTRRGGEVELSVAAPAVQPVQKVEFYIENQFVGAAYAAPFSVVVSESSLSAGGHTVTAKIYISDTASAATQPTTFIAQSSTPGSASSTGSNPPSQDSTDNNAPAPAAKATLAAPLDVAAVASADGAGAGLGWDAVAGATHYQVWRDSVLVATVGSAVYSDTGLNPGQTYDYQIVAVGSDGSTSALSAIASVTMPVAQSAATPTAVPTPPDSSAAAQ